MAVNAELNALGQMRVDIPHLKMIESGVRYDFDALAYMLTGDASYIVKGFELVSGAIGDEATKITYKVAGSKVIHPLASESGSFFVVPSNRPNDVLNSSLNPRMRGSCQPNSTNYIGIDLLRSADSTTADTVQFLNPSLNTESPQKVPLRRTLDYVWVITIPDFSYNKSVLPVAIVTTDAFNRITEIVDARGLLGRLNPGGSNITDITAYGWPGGRDATDESTKTSTIYGDKALTDLKSWMNAVMTRLHELGGGQYWYSIAADRNVNFHTGGSVFTSTGESFEVDTGHLHWRGLSFTFDNNTSYSKALIEDQLTSVTGLTDLADGECIYVDLNRNVGTSLTAQKGTLTTLGSSTRPGQRWVLASRIGANYYVTGQPWPVGSSFKLATTTVSGTLKANLDVNPITPIAATVIPLGIGSDYLAGIITGKGLSNNHDIGTARLYDTNSDIKIGRGVAAGDLSVMLKTDGDHSVIATGDPATTAPRLMVRTNGVMGFGAPGPKNVHLDLDQQFIFDGARTSSVTSIVNLPLAPTSYQTGNHLQYTKYFTKQTKTWKLPVTYYTNSSAILGWSTLVALSPTYTIINTGSTAIFHPDGFDVVVGDRILVNVTGFDYNGVYEVIGTGGGGFHTRLARTNDFGGAGSITELGLGYDLFDGVSVKITSGTTHHDTYWTLSLPAKTGVSPVAATPTLWTQTNTDTSDQVCVMWTDGSYTAIATSPIYAGTT